MCLMSVIIPCYNEKNTIESILEKILKSLNDYKIFNYEIIIVDDNPIVIRLVTVIGILSLDCLTACLITMGTKLAMANP